MSDLYIAMFLLGILLIIVYNSYSFIAAGIVFGLVLYYLNVEIVWLEVYVVVFLILTLKPLRRNLFSKPLIALINKFKLLPAISETEKHHHTGGWTPSKHYGMCGQSCPCCRAEIEETPFGVCPICWKNLDKGPLPDNY